MYVHNDINFNFRYTNVDYHQSDAHSFDPRSVDQRQNHSEMEISEIAKSLREVPIFCNIANLSLQ